MWGINTYTYTISLLIYAGLAKGCAYPRYLNETGDDYTYRRCTTGCDAGDMVIGNPNYDGCCRPILPGSSVPATCTVIAQSVSAAGTVTCPHTSIATTDSTGMAAPTGYSPAYPTAAATTAAVTGDTAGQNYESSAPGITTLVTETASPDCAVPSSTPTAASSTSPVESTYPTSSASSMEPTYTPSSSWSSTTPSETPSSTAPASTCACPAAVSSAPPAETSGASGEDYTSQDGNPSPNYGSKPGAGDDTSGLDRRLEQRTDVQYTCECPAPGAETGDNAGQGYSSASSTAPGAEPTDDCEDGDPSPTYGDKPDGEVTDNEPASKRFIPLDYPISHPIHKRVMYGPPGDDFVPEDGIVVKRTEPTESVTDNSSTVPTTVTSTTTITAPCSSTDAAQTSVYDSSVSSSTTGGDVVTSAPSTTTTGADGLSGAVSGVIDGSSFSLSGTLAIPTDGSPVYGAKPDASDGPVVDNVSKRSKPDGEIVDNVRKRRISSL